MHRLSSSFSFLVLCSGLAACGGGSDADSPGGPTPDAGADHVAPPDDAEAEAAPDAQDTGAGGADGAPDATADAQPDIGPDATEDTGTDAAEDAPADAPVEAGHGPGCIEGDHQAYFGNLHAHTSYSDGVGVPSDAFAHARDVAGLDVMVVTDHLEQLYWPAPMDRWGKCRQQADDANAPGTFLAACGFEYGSGFAGITSTGHNNVFFSDGLLPMVQTDYHDFYQSLLGCPGCVAQFNHPDSEDGQTWSDFSYDAAVDERIQVFEFNGGGDVWHWFFAALDAGWHVSPMLNQDNHSADWGSKNDTRSGLWMPHLSRVGLYDALANRRTFMTEDKNATIRLMADTDCWMGSIMSGITAVSINVEVIDSDAGDGFATIELYGPGQQLLDTHDCQAQDNCTFSASFDVTGPTYVVARATQGDGNLLISAPVWVAP